MLYHSEDRLGAAIFGDDSITRHCSLSNTQVSEYNPNWVNTKVERHILSDET